MCTHRFTQAQFYMVEQQLCEFEKGTQRIQTSKLFWIEH